MIMFNTVLQTLVMILILLVVMVLMGTYYLVCCFLEYLVKVVNRCRGWKS
jgi:hypothetical protein